jgi:hypothetical protein
MRTYNPPLTTTEVMCVSNALDKYHRYLADKGDSYAGQIEPLAKRFDTMFFDVLNDQAEDLGYADAMKDPPSFTNPYSDPGGKGHTRWFAGFQRGIQERIAAAVVEAPKQD